MPDFRQVSGKWKSAMSSDETRLVWTQQSHLHVVKPDDISFITEQLTVTDNHYRMTSFFKIVIYVYIAMVAVCQPVLNDYLIW